MSPRGSTAAPAGVSRSRAVAFSVLRRVFEQGAYADRALTSEAAELEPRDRALTTILVYGTVQRRATLDHVLGRLSSRALGRLDAPVLTALRLGLYQLLMLDGVPAHAAVSESVELVKPGGRGGAGLVNAVLRRAIRDAGALLDELDDSTAQRAAILYSVPSWLAELWWEELGAAQARGLLAAVNRPAEAAIRVNELVSSVPEVQRKLTVTVDAAPGLPEGLVLREAFDVHGSPLFTAGAITPQSRASMLAARVLAPSAGDRVLDLCAAPGAKTTHLAALMRDQGEVVAVERHQGRAQALERTARRLHASCVRVEIADAAQARRDGRYTRVLVDPPCSGLGTLQSRPDLRWRVSTASIAELSELQSQILARAGEATAPGGTITYSVCTISRSEGEDVVSRFLQAHPDFAAEDLSELHPEWAHPRDPRFLQLLPNRDGTDGFFIARLLRRSVRSATVTLRR